MRNILWVVCWLSLLVSQSSKAYEQEYNVGDTGPNGGVVTSVTVESVLSDSYTELVGDFLETTDTYTYTETVVEEKPEGDWDDLKDFGLMALTMLLIF